MRKSRYADAAERVIAFSAPESKNGTSTRFCTERKGRGEGHLSEGPVM